MQKAKLREGLILFESHHIIPRSLGGDNSIDNIVKLSPREHFISHALLTKMVSDKSHKRSMAYAFVRMRESNNKTGYSRIGNGKLYEKMRTKAIASISGENNPFYGNHRFAGAGNPFYGKTHTDEIKNRLSEKLKVKMLGEGNPFYGKTHADEIKEKISSRLSKPVIIVFKDGSSKRFSRKIDIGEHFGICKAMGVQLCSIKRHLWDSYNIKEILSEDQDNKKN